MDINNTLYSSGELGNGIHGNNQCVRCGACCYYPSITKGKRGGRLVFKRHDEPCKHLSLNTDGNFSCNVYSGERPEACTWFNCYRGAAVFRSDGFREKLIEASREVKHLFETGENVQMQEQIARRSLLSDIVYYLKLRFF